ncbi:flavin reductase family protein [Rhodotorula paludigena]|uniref:flavin reductase family protein n=1 Tax=Rhodotorula paludigena TaxID=86838 RepID=UPI00316CC9C8
MSRRLRIPLQPWLARASSTLSKAALPSPLQRELFRRVAQPVACITAHLPSSTSGKAQSEQDLGDQQARHNHGATLSSLASISVSPPLVSFSLRLPSRLASFLSPPPPPGAAAPPSPSFRVHLLSTAQEHIARAFARQPPLPAPAQPSPPQSSTGGAGWDASTEPHFPPELFDELERSSLGYLDCRVVQRLPLSHLGSSGAAPAGEASAGAQGGWQPRSELFIAEIEAVKLGEGGERNQSLLYWEQRYAGVQELPGVDPTGDGVEKR